MPPSVSQALRGKTVLLTGGTGFLGKVIVERLLRWAPDIERIYLLIRTRPDPDEAAVPAATRFETAVLASPAFDSLAKAHGDDWTAFARAKLIPVAGDVSQARLGLTDADHASLATSTDI